MKSKLLSQLSKDGSKSGRLEVKEGKKLKIKCKADGNPVPKINWLLNNTLIDPQINKEYHIQIKGNMSSLIIREVHQRHTGNYSCTASNNNGSLSKWVYVTVIAPPPRNGNMHSSSTKNATAFTSSPPSVPFSVSSSIRLDTDKHNQQSPNLTLSNESDEKCSHVGGCLNGACKRNRLGGYQCRCYSSYTGIRCDQIMSSVNRSEPCITFQNKKELSIASNKLFSIIGFGFSIVLVLLLLSILCFYKFRRRSSAYVSGVKCRKMSNKAIQVNVEVPTIQEKLMPYNTPTADLLLPSKSLTLLPQHLDVRSPTRPHNESDQIDNYTGHHKILLSVNNIPYNLFTPTSSNSRCINTSNNPNSLRLTHPQLPSISATSKLSSSTEATTAAAASSSSKNQLPKVNDAFIQLNAQSPTPCIYSTLGGGPTNPTDADTFTLDNYVSNLIPISFSCTDPCCCLNVESTKLYTSSIPNPATQYAATPVVASTTNPNSSIISLHNPAYSATLPLYNPINANVTTNNNHNNNNNNHNTKNNNDINTINTYV